MNTFVLQETITNWGINNIKTFPWRNINDPYKILISEFMLHRTQVNQVIPVFNEFIESYPTLDSIHLDDEEKILGLLKPLGLNWRIKGMFSALNELNQNFGKIPLDFTDLLSIRGIGPYIAGATICFSQNLPLTLIDTNIIRVLGRAHGLNLSGEARRRKEIINVVAESVDKNSPRIFYYSLIDLAHDYCLPRHPNCYNCPLSRCNCSYFDTCIV